MSNQRGICGSGWIIAGRGIAHGAPAQGTGVRCRAECFSGAVLSLRVNLRAHIMQDVVSSVVLCRVAAKDLLWV